jgi:hypothetical protein
MKGRDILERKKKAVIVERAYLPLLSLGPVGEELVQVKVRDTLP